jgi:hypothetical protein
MASALGSEPPFAADAQEVNEPMSALGSKPTSKSFCQMTALS